MIKNLAQPQYSFIPDHSPLYPISLKIKNQQRINTNDALTLFQSQDLHAISYLASLVKSQKHQTKVFYVLNAHINYSNVCSLKCSFCSFKKKLTDPDSYFMSVQQIQNQFLAFQKSNIQEIHIVGGLHPSAPFSYYVDLVHSIRQLDPKIAIKAFTAVEIHHFARIFHLDTPSVLLELKNHGLSLLPGGGAEIFHPDIRQNICPSKINAQTWLQVHQQAHQLGIKSNATMLFGHVESYQHRIHHLSQLRQLQDQTHGFLSFIPLTYHPLNNPLQVQRTSVFDELKTIAVSRIFLDNFPHIKSYWIMLGIPIAQIALNFGADDLDGTVLEEKITHAAGSKAPKALSQHQLIQLIQETGQIPVQRNAFYQPIS